MIQFLLASNNSNKVREFKSLLSQELHFDFDVLSLNDIGYTQDIVEDGSTFEENALIKAKVGAALGYITFADDSGLCVEALNGAPGIFSARYSGVHGNTQSNNELLLKNLNGIDNRNAKFVCSIACAFPDGRSFTVRGECFGSILRELQGNNGFGYDPLFYYEPLKKSFADLTMDEKLKVSHRGIATKLFLTRFKKELNFVN